MLGQCMSRQALCRQHVASGFHRDRRRVSSSSVTDPANNKALTVSVDPLEPIQIQCSGPTCGIPIFVTAVGAIAAAYWFKRKAQEPSKKLPEPWPEMPLLESNPVAYKRALARTRQAQDVQRAVSYMHAGETARAMTELHRALEENNICRSPLLDGHQTKEELVQLYKLHIQNTEFPPQFAILLQLRAMLNLSHTESEQIEEEALHESQTFSI